MTDYATMLIKTPGGRLVEVEVVESRHRIRGPSGVMYQVPLLTQSGVKFTARCIQERIDHGRNCSVLMTGDPGIGKSTAISEIAREVDSQFEVDNVTFTLEEFENKFKHNPYGDGEKRVYPQISMDEAAHAMYGPEYMKEEQRVIAKNLIVSRIKKQTVYFCSPKRKLLNPHLREMVHIWIHVSEPKEFLQGYARVRFAPPSRQSEFFTEKYWEPKYAFIFGPDTSEFWQRYEARKIQFLNEALESKSHGKRDDVISTIVHNLKQKMGLSQKEIAQIIGRNQSTVSRLLSSSTDTHSTTTIDADA